MVIYPEGVWYTYNSIEDAEEILQRHLIKGERVERLMLQPEDKLPEDRVAAPQVRAMSTTIFALATPAGRSGVAIIRISGPLRRDLRRMTRAICRAARCARRKFYAAHPSTPHPALSRRGRGSALRELE